MYFQIKMGTPTAVGFGTENKKADTICLPDSCILIEVSSKSISCIEI